MRHVGSNAANRGCALLMVLALAPCQPNLRFTSALAGPSLPSGAQETQKTGHPSTIPVNPPLHRGSGHSNQLDSLRMCRWIATRIPGRSFLMGKFCHRVHRVHGGKKNYIPLSVLCELCGEIAELPAANAVGSGWAVSPGTTGPGLVPFSHGDFGCAHVDGYRVLPLPWQNGLPGDTTVRFNSEKIVAYLPAKVCEFIVRSSPRLA